MGGPQPRAAATRERVFSREASPRSAGSASSLDFACAKAVTSRFIMLGISSARQPLVGARQHASGLARLSGQGQIHDRPANPPVAVLEGMGGL
jgi:hypothetical protein